MKNLFLNVLTPISLNDRDLAERILETLEANSPGIMPEAFGNWEPLRQRYEKTAALDAWSDPFLWKRARPSTSGSFWMPPTKQHGALMLATDSDRTSVKSLANLLVAWCKLVNSDFGLVELVMPDDVERGLATGALTSLDAEGKRFDLSVTTHHLQRGLPDVYSYMVFGPAYVTLFGKEHLLKCPAKEVREVGDNQILVQLVEDPRADRAATIAARLSVRAHLGHGAFGPAASVLADFQFG